MGNRNFSIIIITHNRERLLMESIQSVLAEIKRYEGTCEILVINSSEKAYHFKKPIKEIYVPNIIPASSKRNIGIGAAKYQWLLFMDDDCKMSQDALKTAAKYISKKNGDGTAGFYCITRFGAGVRFPLRCCLNTHFTSSFSWAKQMEKMPWGPTSLAILKKNILEDIGGFDENFSALIGGEDVDIGMRLNEKNYILYGIPEVLVYHNTESWNKFIFNLKRFYRYGKCDTDLQVKHKKYTHLKLNSMLFPVLYNLLLLLGCYLLNIKRNRVYLIFPFYLLFNSLLFYWHYYKSYKKNLGESLVLRIYDWTYEVGNLISSLKKKKIRPLFFRSHSDIRNHNRLFWGRHKVLYQDERVEIFSLLFTLIFFIYI